ncbi:MAG: hypothetical protein JNK81_15685 [Anaerolineales bacterium]|nr:hypothetical protein [Anaerolineales bacterium]
MNYQLSNKKQEKGQGLVEYSLTLVLVGIVVIAALMVLGPRIGCIFSNINSSLSGGTGGSCAAAAAPTGPQTFGAPYAYASLNQQDAINNYCSSHPSGTGYNIYTNGGWSMATSMPSTVSSDVFSGTGTCP